MTLDNVDALVEQWCKDCHQDGACRTGTGHADLKRRVTEFVDRVSRQALERAAAEIPTNWLDPLLAAPTLQGKPGEWGCPDVERLLQGVAARVRALKAEVR